MAASKLASSLVKKVFASDKRIQFCAVVGPDGKIEEGGMRPGVRSLEPPEETERIVTKVFLNLTINQTIDPYLGRAIWAMIRREKLVQITFPLRDQRQLQLAASLDFPISKIPRIRQYVSKLDARR